MVSFQAMISLEKKKPCFDLELSTTVSSKKRKREDEDQKIDDEAVKEGLELHLESPSLPFEWERCLDIKSGQIHYYNTRTHKRTSRDPRASPEKSKPKSMPTSPVPDLDLELNLTCNSKEYNSKSNSNLNLNFNLNSSDQTEMIATVCMKCHMFVMMCKATLSCPSCKFVHPQTRNPPGWVKPGFDLLCCKD